MNQSDEIVVLSGEPYLKEDVLLKVDPEEYIWQAELSDWISSNVFSTNAMCSGD